MGECVFAHLKNHPRTEAAVLAPHTHDLAFAQAPAELGEECEKDHWIMNPGFIQDDRDDTQGDIAERNTGNPIGADLECRYLFLDASFRTIGADRLVKILMRKRQLIRILFPEFIGKGSHAADAAADRTVRSAAVCRIPIEKTGKILFIKDKRSCPILNAGEGIQKRSDKVYDDDLW